MGSGQTTVEVENGSLRGLELDSAIVFHGIPFARPPIGNLRWTAPRPPENWDGVRDATTPGPECAQNQFAGGVTTQVGSEDCLYLNVWVPKIPERNRGKLSVMVWIHDGAL